MKRFLPVAALLLFSSVPFPAAAASPTEGLTLDQRGEAVVFRVERADTDSIRVQVFDHERDTVLFDSGWSPDAPVAWRPSTEVVGPWRYRVEARDGRGALVLSHTGIRDAGPLQAAPQPSSHGPSVMNVGSAGSTGSLRTFLEGSSVAVSRLGSNAGGGSLRLLDEEGFTISELTSDTHGTGAFFSLSRDQGETGFFFDGNKIGTGEPLMALTGSTRSAVFDMSVGGDSSVELPLGSISALEILNEAGATSTNGTDIVFLGTSDTELLEGMIFAPSTGYVLAIGTVQIDISHHEGTSDSFTVGIALNGTEIPPEQEFRANLSGSVLTGIFGKVVTVHGLFAVDPGLNTLRLLARDSGGTISADDRHLSLVFVPTGYNAIVIPPGQTAAAAESTDHSSERPENRIATEELAREHLALELKVMKERLQQLEQILETQSTRRP